MERSAGGAVRGMRTGAASSSGVRGCGGQRLKGGSRGPEASAKWRGGIWLRNSSAGSG